MKRILGLGALFLSVAIGAFADVRAGVDNLSFTVPDGWRILINSRPGDRTIAILTAKDGAARVTINYESANDPTEPLINSIQKSARVLFKEADDFVEEKGGRVSFTAFSDMGESVKVYAMTMLAQDKRFVLFGAANIARYKSQKAAFEDIFASVSLPDTRNNNRNVYP